MMDLSEFEDSLETRGIDIRKRYPKAFAKALKKVYAAQVAHKDFRKILRKMED